MSRYKNKSAKICMWRNLMKAVVNCSDTIIFWHFWNLPYLVNKRRSLQFFLLGFMIFFKLFFPSTSFPYYNILQAYKWNKVLRAALALYKMKLVKFDIMIYFLSHNYLKTSFFFFLCVTWVLTHAKNVLYFWFNVPIFILYFLIFVDVIF